MRANSIRIWIRFLNSDFQDPDPAENGPDSQPCFALPSSRVIFVKQVESSGTVVYGRIFNGLLDLLVLPLTRTSCGFLDFPRGTGSLQAVLWIRIRSEPKLFAGSGSDKLQSSMTNIA